MGVSEKGPKIPIFDIFYPVALEIVNLLYPPINIRIKNLAKPQSLQKNPGHQQHQRSHAQFKPVELDPWLQVLEHICTAAEQDLRQV